MKPERRAASERSATEPPKGAGPKGAAAMPSGGAKGPNEPTLDREIAAALMEDIIAWRIPPGVWIRERDVATRFACSHAPVRESFRHLAQVGLVEVVPWRGAHVFEVEHYAVMDVFDLWKSTFGVVCGLTASRFDLKDAPALEALRDDYFACVRRTENTLEHVDVAWRIGAFISARCESPLVFESLRRVSQIARWQHHLIDHPSIAALQPTLGLQSAELYANVVAAIIARNKPSAENAGRAFLDFTQQYMGRALEAIYAEHTNSEPVRRPRKRL